MKIEIYNKYDRLILGFNHGFWKDAGIAISSITTIILTIIKIVKHRKTKKITAYKITHPIKLSRRS